MDPETGLIQLKCDDAWLNGYNPWIMLMLRANHDCKFLFSQIYALAIIHYVMKYISKPEQATHAKLTIAAAVRKDLSDTVNETTSPTNPGKRMLSKVYNRLDSHREVGIPEAISHLCGFPDHYTSASFVNLNTKTVLYHVHRRHDRNVASMQMHPTDDDDDIDENNNDTSSAEVFDSEILQTHMDIDYCRPLMITSIAGNTFPACASTIMCLCFTRNAAAMVFHSTMSTLRQIHTLKFFASRLSKFPTCLVEFYSSDRTQKMNR